MTGSLQIKNDKYFAVLNIYDQNGKRKQKWLTTGLAVKGNNKKAEQLLREYLREYEVKAGIINTDMLFCDAIRHWLTVTEKRVDAVTLQGYTCLATAHIIPYFEQRNIKLKDINRRVLQAYIDEKSQNGRLDGKGGLSPRSLILHKNVLFQALTEAVRDELIPNNPCEYIIVPQTQRYESKFYSAEQIATLLNAIKDEALYFLIKLTAVYGLRRSEVLGLKWDSIDFNVDTLAIKHTVSKVTEVVEKDKTKNATEKCLAKAMQIMIMF